MRIKTEGKEYDVYLVDDGTMDTVIKVEDREYRYDMEFAADFRKQDGSFSNKGFRELALDAIDSYETELAEAV